MDNSGKSGTLQIKLLPDENDRPPPHLRRLTQMRDDMRADQRR
jgi:hypothetical protein